MRNTILSFLLLCPLFAAAQNNAAALLDKIVSGMKADAALQLDYAYSVFDEDDAMVYSDNGTMKLDKER